MDLSILWYVISGLLVLLGFVINIVNLPGIWVIFLGYLVLFFVKDSGVGPGIVFIALLVSAFASIIDNVFSFALSKKYGATKWGMIGSFVGSIIGVLIFNLPGLVIGLFLGAFIAEAILLRRALRESAQSGISAVVGWFVGVAIKLFLGFLLALLWFVLVIF